MSIFDASAIVLKAGRHHNPSEGLCITEAAALWAGEAHSDHPECVCPALAAFARVLNDALPSRTRTPILLPLLPALVCSRPADPTQAERLAQRRAIVLALWAARTAAPAVLRSESEYRHAALCAIASPSLRATERCLLSTADTLAGRGLGDAAQTVTLCADALAQARYHTPDHAARLAGQATALAVRVLWRRGLEIASRSGSSPRAAARLASGRSSPLWDGAVATLRLAAGVSC